MTYEQARLLFAAKIEELGGLKETGAVLGGKSEATVSMIRSGKRKPSFRLAALIESMWGIPIAAWFTGRKPKKRKARHAA